MKCFSETRKILQLTGAQITDVLSIHKHMFAIDQHRFIKADDLTGAILISQVLGVGLVQLASLVP